MKLFIAKVQKGDTWKVGR